MEQELILLMAIELLLLLKPVRIHKSMAFSISSGLFQDISFVVTRLASVLWRILLGNLLYYTSRHVDVKWLILLGAVVTFVPGINAAETVRSVCGGGRSAFPLLALLGFMVLPLLCLPMGDGDTAAAHSPR